VELALLSARLLLGAVFGVAGVAKLADRAGSRQAVREFGVPAALAGPAGDALPVAELVVAALLVPTVTAWAGAIGALGLLGAFVAGIAYNIARGRAPECHCFGQLHSEPAGPRTLARNGALAGVAGFVIVFGRADPGTDVLALLGRLATDAPVLLLSGAVVALVVAANAVVLFQVLRQQGRLVRRVRLLEAQVLSGTSIQLAEGLPVGTPAPTFELPDLHGRPVALADLLDTGRPLLLAFLDPECGPCRALVPRLWDWHAKLGERHRVVLVSRGSAEANVALLAGRAFDDVVLQRQREVDELYHVESTPGAVVVRADGTIASAHAVGAEQIESLLAGLTGALGDSPLASVASGGHVHGDQGVDHERGDQGADPADGHAGLGSVSSA